VPVSRTLRRLLRILELEEEQSRRVLESAVNELQRLERALNVAAERERRGRRLIAASAESGELTDRVSGVEESHAAMRRAALIAPWIEDAQREAEALRQAYLAKRVERRQAEALIQKAESREAIEAGRRNQQALDDWYLNRVHRTAGAEPNRDATSVKAHSDLDAKP